jgi:hypothetical protein
MSQRLDVSLRTPLPHQKGAVFYWGADPLNLPKFRYRFLFQNFAIDVLFLLEVKSHQID